MRSDLTRVASRAALAAALIVCTAFAVSCESERTPTFSVSPAVAELTFSTDGTKAFSGQSETTAKFKVSTNQREWSVELSEEDSWLRVAESEDMFTLSAPENTDMEARGPITVIVRSGNAPAVVMEVTQQGVAATLPTIYMAGRYAVAGEDEQCAFLKDGELFVLGKSGSSGITGIAAGGVEVYMSGYETEDGKASALYWKGAEKVYLPQTGSCAYAGDIFVSGSDVYAAGTDHYVSKEGGEELYDVVYWKNDKKYVLEEGLNASSARNFTVGDIVVAGKDIYVVGTETRTGNDPHTQFLVCWKNGEASVIDEGEAGFIVGSGMDLAVSGSDVYVSGNLSADGVNYGGYWKNGVFTRLEVDGNDVAVKAMAVSGNDVCIAGDYTDGAGNKSFLWKNGEVTVIEPEGGSAGYYVEIYDVAVHNGKAFVSGIEGNYAERKGDACYWVDGVTKVTVEVPLTAGLFVPVFMAATK